MATIQPTGILNALTWRSGRLEFLLPAASQDARWLGSLALWQPVKPTRSSKFGDAERTRRLRQEPDRLRKSASRGPAMKRDGNKIWNDFIEGEKDMRTGKPPKWTSSGGSAPSFSPAERSSKSESASKVLFDLSQTSAITQAQVSSLLCYGADPTWRNVHDERCALHHLAERGNVKILKLLSRTKGVSFHVKDYEGITVLMAACMATPSANNAKVVKLLLRRSDVGVDDLDHCGHSAVYHAWQARNIAALRRLLLAKVSLLNCIREFSEEIPLLFRLYAFLAHHGYDAGSKLRISSASNLEKPKELETFFSATQLHPEMVDYYFFPAFALSLRAAVSGSKAVVDGMVAFGVREELRARKKFSVAQMHPVESPAVELDDISFRSAVETSRQRRLEVKARRQQQAMNKRKAMEDDERESRKKTELERIDKMFAERKS